MTKTWLNPLIFASAMAAIFSLYVGFDTAFSLLKPLTTILIIFVPLLASSDQPSALRTATIVALIACLGGDVLLLDEAYFVYGLASFLLAQLIFAVIFFKLADRQFYYLLLLGLLVFGSASFYQLLPYLSGLAVPVAVYTGCILLMCWQGISVYLVRKDNIGKLIAIGALLFVFSDSMISVNKFLHPFDLSGLIILSSYWLAITMIANGLRLWLETDRSA